MNLNPNNAKRFAMMGYLLMIQKPPLVRNVPSHHLSFLVITVPNASLYSSIFLRILARNIVKLDFMKTPLQVNVSNAMI